MCGGAPGIAANFMLTSLHSKTEAEAKLYRRISLTSLLLKNLGKVIDEYLRESVPAGLPIHKNQYAIYAPNGQILRVDRPRAFSASRNCCNKDISLSIFLDIAVAFEGVLFGNGKSAAKRGVKPVIRTWISSMLRNGSCITEPQNVRKPVALTWSCGFPTWPP